MRKGDLELLEVRLEPLQTARDRHDQDINEVKRQVKDLCERLDSVERDRTSFALTMDQAANSVRSLLQQANKRLRDARIIEPEEEVLTEAVPEGNTAPVSPAPRLTAKGRRII